MHWTSWSSRCLDLSGRHALTGRVPSCCLLRILLSAEHEQLLQQEVLKVVPIRHMSVVPMVARMLVAEALTCEQQQQQPMQAH